MIKCDGFLKLLKQLFSIGLISCFTFGLSCFASDGYIYQIGGTHQSPFDSSVNFSVLPKGSYLSSTLGYGKPIFAWSNGGNKTFLWWKNGLPYYYQDYQNWEELGVSYGFQCQGFVNSYSVCEEILQDSFTASSCTSYNMGEGSINAFRNFLSTVKSSDYYAVIRYRYYQHYIYPTLCISSSELHQSLCFAGGTRGQGSCNLTGSMEIPWGLDFTNINSYFYDNSSPAVSDGGTNGNVGGGSINIVGITTTGSLTSDCTNGQVIQFYENQGFNTNLCYGGLDSYNTTVDSGVLAIPGTGIDVMGMWFDLEPSLNYKTRFDFYRTAYNKSRLALFSGKPYVLQTYFGFVNDYGAGKSSEDILEYCDVKLYKRNNNGLFTGFIISESRKQKICNVSSMYFPGNSVDENGNVLNIVGNDLLGNGSGTTTYSDGSSFINDTLNKFKEVWQIPEKGDFGLGFLPQYILSFLCLIILFRFLSH